MKTIIKAALAGICSVGLSAPVQAGDNPYVGEIMTTAANFCPRGWLETDGQLLAIFEYDALFSLLGTYYGGDGRTTFALPDLRGKAVIGVGQAPGLPDYSQGSYVNNGTVNAKTGDQPVTPALALKNCIAVVGIYPSRN